MANDLNTCMFIGRLGKDPEQRYLPDGTEISTFSIACGWKSKDKEGTEWVRVVVFGKLAEICGQYLKKGAQVFIQGRFTTRKWEKDGQTHYSTEINADRMQMLGSKPAGDDEPSQPRSQPSKPAKQAASAPADADDDIPFGPRGRRSHDAL